MKPGAHVVLGAAARTYGPLIALFALTLLVARAPGAGVGFIAGLAFGLAFVMHALVFGAAASRAAMPALALRALLAGGLIASLVGAGTTPPFAPQLIEGGLFATTAAAAALIVLVLFGRAPTLRDAEL